MEQYSPGGAEQNNTTQRIATVALVLLFSVIVLLSVTSSSSSPSSNSTVSFSPSPISQSPVATKPIKSPSSSSPAYQCSADTSVHVIFSNHLDVGFHAYSPNGFFAADVIQQALNDWLPNAIKYEQEMRNFNSSINPYNDTFIWMAHPWTLSLALDCPPHMNYTCLSSATQTALIDAMKRGVITWHAFPFNSEAEVHNAELFEFGIQMTHDLADKYNIPRPRTISQRDVPGSTIAIIPLLIQHGVYAFSIGANPAAQPPQVPTAFTWRNSNNEEIILLYHPGQYGGIGVNDAVIIDGFNHIALFDWNNDNAGPYSPQTYLDHLTQIRKNFIGCAVKVSTFDNFVVPLHDAIQSGKVKLPVITDEMGDTW